MINFLMNEYEELKNIEISKFVFIMICSGTSPKKLSEIVEDPIVGQIYEGKIVKLMDFGAFVNFYGKRDGLVHVSQISEERVNHPKDVLTEGQNVKVKLMGIDDRGKSKLSMKVIDQSTGKEVEKES